MHGKKEIITLILIFTFLGVLYSYPLITHLFRGIPYTHMPDQRYELAVVRPEDNLLTFYWFWLMKDNLFGKSRIFSNPYEFNSIDGRENYGFYMFPFSLFFVIFSFMGNIAAYNSVVILSFVLAAMAAYYLCKFYTSDWKSSLIAGIIFSIAPFRVAQLLAGHLNGFLFFLIPLYFLLLELLVLKKKLIFSIGAGLVLLSLAAMEFHLLYYVLLFTSLFFFFKLFRLKDSLHTGEEKEIVYSKVYNTIDYWAGVSVVLLSGMGLGFFVSLVNIRSGSYSLGFSEVAFSCVLYATMLFFIWFLYSRFFSRFTKLNLPNAQIIDSWTYSPLMILFLYPVQYKLDLPFLGKALFLMSLIGVLIAKISNLKKYSNQRIISFSIEINSVYKEIKSFLYPLFFLLPWVVLSAGYVFYLRKLFMDKSFTATGGRPYSLIMRNSPRISDIFLFQNPNGETLISPGIITVILSFIGIVVILNKLNSRTEVSLRNILFYGASAFFAFILSLGPSLDGIFPLYKYLYKYLPYFNYPRVPGRLAIMTFLGLSILAGFGSKIIIERMRINRKTIVYSLIIFFILLNYPMWNAGISIGDENNKIYKKLKKEIKTDEVLLEIPIFPGDTHYTSVYQYYVTTTQVKMVNGYNPLVSRKYVQDVFLGLENMNLGEIREKEYDLLRKLNVGFVLLHENVYPPKVSPFPGSLALKNMKDSPYLRLIDSDGILDLFEVRKDSGMLLNSKQKFNHTSIVSALYESEEMPRNTGELFEEKDASGGFSVYGNPAKHQEGTLVFGPYQKLPTGEYTASFRLKAQKGPNESKACVIDIATKKGREILSSKIIYKKDFKLENVYQDFALNFSLHEPERVEFRVEFLKKVEIWSDYVIVSFLGFSTLRDYYEIEDFKIAGKRKEDKEASGGWAVVGESGKNSAPDLIFGYGPYARMEPGNYEVKFRLKVTEKPDREKEVAILYIGTNKGQKVLAERILKGDDFEKLGSYQDFVINYKCEMPVVIDFSLYFKNNATLWADRIDIIRMP